MVMEQPSLFSEETGMYPQGGCLKKQSTTVLGKHGPVPRLSTQVSCSTCLSLLAFSPVSTLK